MRRIFDARPWSKSNIARPRRQPIGYTGDRFDAAIARAGGRRRIACVTMTDGPQVQPPAISLTSAVCLRAGHPVLRGISLEVAPGEAVLVTGANGTGKTTLLRLLAGLLPLAAGEGKVSGYDLKREAAQVRRAVALVGHESFSYDDLTVRDNLLFHARMSGVDTAIALETLHDLGLEPLADRSHGQLSAGQRRRSALAIALMQRRPLLLLDEPHAALDVEGRSLVNDAVVASTRSGTTVVVVTHEADLVRPLVDREVTLREGRLGETPPLKK
jgi:ABC-2 type transport system ATP-binding protein